MSPSSQIGGCAFCPRVAKLSGEHMWSAWMGRLMGKSDFFFRDRDAQKNRVSYWKSSGLNKKLKCVCERCNNGWMSQLESRAKSVMADMIIHRKKVLLNSEMLHSIAQFAFKSAVIADSTAKGRFPFFPTIVRRRFAQHLTIPAGVQMWLATFNDPLGPGHSGFFLSRYVKIKASASPMNGVEFYVLTFTAGFLVVQVVASRWCNPLHMSQLVEPSVAQTGDWPKFSIPFWPIEQLPIRWPPQVLTSHEDIYNLAERWKGICIPPVLRDLWGVK